MSDSPRDTYVTGIDPAQVPSVLELDRLVMAAAPNLTTKISYDMLMYGLDGDFRHFVCAVDAGRPRGSVATARPRRRATIPVRLRFLYGTLLSDPKHTLRSAGSHLSSIDFASIEDIDAQVVSDYVKEAVARHEEFKASLGS